MDDNFYNDAGNLSGLSIAENREKIYFSQSRSSWSEYRKKGTELCVSYWDSLNNNWDGNPWITSDGKILFFSSSRNINWEDSSNTHDIYISYLLVDENGNTVTSVNKNEKQVFNFRLMQNYPNPFNPVTNIEYEIKRKGFVRLLIYNSLGQKICQPVNEEKSSGNYSVEFNPSLYGLSSGTYYYQLLHNGHYSVKNDLN